MFWPLVQQLKGSKKTKPFLWRFYTILGALFFFFIAYRWRIRRRLYYLKRMAKRSHIEKEWLFKTLNFGPLSIEQLPAVLVNIPIFNENINNLGKIAERNGKTIRIATKSLRVPHLIKHILEVGGPVYKGLMCYAVDEAYLLVNTIGIDYLLNGGHDILIAYPTVQHTELDKVWELVVEHHLQIHLMVDKVCHIELLEEYWASRVDKKQIKIGDRAYGTFKDTCLLSVCIDADMSYRPLGNLLHLGTHRSHVRSLKDFMYIATRVAKSDYLCLGGVMGYEAQIAGVLDASPFQSSLMNTAIRIFKLLSRRDVTKKRHNISRWIATTHDSPIFFNGGGTGSLETTATEPWLSEITAGSGLLFSSLFDFINGEAASHNLPALCFALRVTREPEAGVVTCQSGGFIASGSINRDKTPIVFHPLGVHPFESEGFGEVQTPLQLSECIQLASGEFKKAKGAQKEIKGREEGDGRKEEEREGIGEHYVPQVGDAIFFRPAKAGEIAERFNEYILVSGGEIIGRVQTYRGLGTAAF